MQFSAGEISIPKGISDFLPEQAEKIGYIDRKIQNVFELWGFRRIIPPLLEFNDVMNSAMGDDLREKTFRFDDRQSGKLLAIPPDITPQIARIVATRLQSYPLPHRLWYSGRVLRHAEQQSGRSREVFQTGVELIGLDSPEADAEMVAMAIEVLQGLGFSNFKIDLGQVEFYRGIMASANVTSQESVSLREAIGKKDVSAVRAIVEKLGLPDRTREAIELLPRLYGGRETLDRADRITIHDRSRRALANLAQVLDILDIHGVASYVTIDLGEIRGLDYYTGLTFEGFVGGMGEAVCSGGRYDTLTARYGFDSPATGFAFSTLALLQLLELRPDNTKVKQVDYLLFNKHGDRSKVLELARHLRNSGYTTARDIIRRDQESSLDYARRLNFRYMLVIGGEGCASDEIQVVRVSDRKSTTVKKAVIMGESAHTAFEFR